MIQYFSGYFDTSVGLKVEASSYTRIAKKINQEPARILFVSDNIKGTIPASRDPFN